MARTLHRARQAVRAKPSQTRCRLPTFGDDPFPNETGESAGGCPNDGGSDVGVRVELWGQRKQKGSNQSAGDGPRAECDCTAKQVDQARDRCCAECMRKMFSDEVDYDRPNGERCNERSNADGP